MIGYGDRTGSANTPEKSISRERTGEIGGTIILSLIARIHERGGVRHARFYESKCNQTIKLDESRRFWNLKSSQNDRLAQFKGPEIQKFES